MDIRYFKLVITTLGCFIAALPVTAYPCGWWGDGEMNRPDTVIIGLSDGKPVSETLSLETSKLPGRMGYGIAVPNPGQAIPYLKATYGRPINRIGELKAFGFGTVIDLGTPPDTARKHREETEALGMRYFNIPIEGPTPSPEQAKLFTIMIIDKSTYPLLVYAPTSYLLGVMWASYLINLGAPLEFAIEEGKALGMMPNQEKELRKRVYTGGE